VLRLPEIQRSGVRRDEISECPARVEQVILTPNVASDFAFQAVKMLFEPGKVVVAQERREIAAVYEVGGIATWVGDRWLYGLQPVGSKGEYRRREGRARSLGVRHASPDRA
jgi:hypothetical protein